MDYTIVIRDQKSCIRGYDIYAITLNLINVIKAKNK